MLTDNDRTVIQSRLGLSGREVQVVEGILNDKTERAVARELGISPHTVHEHLRRIFRKGNVHSRAALCVMVMCALFEE